jgi:hypothetical protein
MAATNSNAINYFSPAKWVVSKVAGEGTHTTIASAIAAAAAGDTIIIMPGTYTENPVLVAGINLTAFNGDANTPNVTIIGTLNCSYSGSVSVSNINLQTNSSNVVSLTGANATVLYLNFCNLNLTNNTGISSTGSNNSAVEIVLYGCTGNLGTTGIAYHSITNGGLYYYYCILNNLSSSSTANTFSGLNLYIRNSVIPNPITTSGVTSTLTINNSEINSSITNSTAINSNSTDAPGGVIENSRLVSGSATPLAIGSGSTMTVSNSTLNSTNSVAVSGAGALVYANLAQEGTVGTISATTITGKGTVGINSGNAPTTGYIGEILSATLPLGSATSLTTSTPKQVISLSITAGTWMVFGTIGFTASVAATFFAAGVNPTTATFSLSTIDYNQVPITTSLANSEYDLNTPIQIITLSSTTTYFLNAEALFATGTCTAHGKVQAIRIA